MSWFQNRLAGIANPPYGHRMGEIGTRIEEIGTLLRESGEFVLRRDLGGRWKLDLHRVAPTEVDQRVRLRGTIVEKDLIDVDSLDPENVLDDAA